PNITPTMTPTIALATIIVYSKNEDEKSTNEHDTNKRQQKL
ncbi:35251_t:CDS:1, partial [Gigaspora margarita]